MNIKDSKIFRNNVKHWSYVSGFDQHEPMVVTFEHNNQLHDIIFFKTIAMSYRMFSCLMMARYYHQIECRIDFRRAFKYESDNYGIDHNNFYNLDRRLNHKDATTDLMIKVEKYIEKARVNPIRID